MLALHGSPLFAGMPVAVIDRLVAAGRAVTFAPGAALICEDRPLTDVHVVTDGAAAVSTMTDDGVRTIALVGPGAVLGEIAALTGGTARSTVRADERGCRTLAVPATLLHEIGAESPELYRNLGRILAERVTHLSRISGQRRSGRVAVLVDEGGDPTAVAALAAAVAYHGGATLLLDITDDGGEDDVNGIESADRSALVCAARAPRGACGPPRLDETAEQLASRFRHVLVRARPDAVEHVRGRRLTLVGRRITHEGLETPIVLPAPTGREAAAIATGRLAPADGPLGVAAGRAARYAATLRVGVALGAGGTRIFGHIGVLGALDAIGVPLDALTGTSAGGIVAALHGLGYHGQDAVDVISRVGRGLRVRPTATAMLSAHALRRHLIDVGGQTRFEDLEIPLALVACDILTGDQVVFTRGLLWSAALATMAIPAMLPPVRMGERLLVDGAMRQSVPVDAARQIGADVVLAVPVGAAAPVSGVAEATEAVSGRVRMLKVARRSIDILQASMTLASAATADIVLEARFPTDGRFSVSRLAEGRRYLPIGEAAVHDAREALAAALPWLAESR